MSPPWGRSRRRFWARLRVLVGPVAVADSTSAEIRSATPAERQEHARRIRAMVAGRVLFELPAETELRTEDDRTELLRRLDAWKSAVEEWETSGSPDAAGEIVTTASALIGMCVTVRRAYEAARVT